jgi:hypothetical protein
MKEKVLSGTIDVTTDEDGRVALSMPDGENIMGEELFTEYTFEPDAAMTLSDTIRDAVKEAARTKRMARNETENDAG